MTKIIVMNFGSHPNEFAFFLRFLPIFPLSSPKCIFMCHKIGQKSVILLFSLLQKINEIIEVKEAGKTFVGRDVPFGKVLCGENGLKTRRIPAPCEAWGIRIQKSKSVL